MVAEFDYTDIDISHTMVISHCVGTVVSVISFEKLKEPDLHVGQGSYISLGNRDFDLSKCSNLKLYSSAKKVIVRRSNDGFEISIEYRDERIPDEFINALSFDDMTKKLQELLTLE